MVKQPLYKETYCLYIKNYILCISKICYKLLCFFIAPDDYSSIDIPLVFVPDDLSNRSLCENISIASDLVVENTEVFTLSLSTTDSAVSFILVSSSVNITDDSSEEEIFVKC